MNSYIESQMAPYAAEFQASLGQKPTARTSSKREVPESAKAVLQQADADYRTWMATPEGVQAQAQMATMDLQQATQMMSAMVGSSSFKATMDMLQNLPNMPDLSNLPLKSFTIGINFEAEVILGFSGTLGFAVGIGESSGVEGVSFLSLGLDEGIEAGAIAGVQFGLWTPSPSDMGGWSFGGELIVDDVAGVAIGAYWSLEGDFLGATLTTGVGADDGGELKESYTFLLTHGSLGIPPMYQPRKSHFLILTKLECVNISGGDGDHNEVFFTFQPDSGTVYPYPTWDYFAMAEGDTWNCGRSVWFDSSVAVKIYDSDGTTSNDLLASGTISLSDLQSTNPKTYDWTTKNGLDEREYKITAQLLF